VKYLTTGEVAKRLGVDTSTVRRWLLDPVERTERFPNLRRTVGGHARIAEADVDALCTDTIPTGRALLYARVPLARHRDLLDLGVAHLHRYAQKRGLQVYDVMTEVGSGFSDRPQLSELRSQIRQSPVPFEVLLVERLDRLVVLGAREFQQWATPIRVEVTGASCPEADAVYQQEIVHSVYYPLADALALRGMTPQELDRILERGLGVIADAVE
jgi:excisionase family DNA binding protein